MFSLPFCQLLFHIWEAAGPSLGLETRCSEDFFLNHQIHIANDGVGEICGFEACKHLEYGLMYYQTLLFAKWLTVFQRNILPPSLGYNLQHHENLTSSNGLNVYYRRYTRYRVGYVPNVGQMVLTICMK
jgi:hypothetical protein